MIVPTMCEEELIREVNADLVNAFRYSDAKDQKFRRMVLKSPQFPVRSYCYYTSPQKNRWIILFEARSKKEIGEMCRITFVCIYNSIHGYHAVMLSLISGKSHLIIYPPHFFSRFGERKGIGFTGVELIRRYFTQNNSYAFDTSKIHTSEIFGSSEEGVSMGIVSELGNVLFRTFITYEMTKGEQVEVFAENERIRREIHYSESLPP